MDSKSVVETYTNAERMSYQEAEKAFPRVSKRRIPRGKQNIWYRRLGFLSDWMLENGHDIPADLIQPYTASVIERVQANVPLKYQYRGLNVLRELCRANLMFPDILKSKKSHSILDLSAGGCGISEVFGHYGHSVHCCDYYGNENMNDVGHSYALIHSELGLTCENFDGRLRPYPFETDSFDLVLSYQAIDAYGPVEEWPEILEELLRIARKSVGLILNPPIPKNDKSMAKLDDFVQEVSASHKTALGNCPETGLVTLRIDHA